MRERTAYSFKPVYMVSALTDRATRQPQNTCHAEVNISSIKSVTLHDRWRLSVKVGAHQQPIIKLSTEIIIPKEHEAFSEEQN